MGHVVRATCASIVGCVLMSSICLAEEAEPREVQPDAELLSKLADPAELTDSYSLRPPKDYEKVMPGGTPRGMIMMAWVGKPRDDGTSAMVQVMIVEPPAGEKSKTPEEMLDAMLGGVKRQRKNWEQTEPERVRINGIDFLRTSWSGNEVRSGKKMHGAMYVTVDGRAHVSIHTQDVEPHHTEALPIGEAAAQTFEKS